MYDRPTLEELIEAARLHIESTVVPAVRGDAKLYFQTLVAINVLKIAGRELQLGDEHAHAEWERLNVLERVEQPIPSRLPEIKAALAARNAGLSTAIRAGVYDADPNALFAHLKATVSAQLEVANPRFLKTLMDEEANPERDAWHNRNQL
ncbi:MAG: DUF6285 domain-containing protein [Anaerolineae bacterium]